MGAANQYRTGSDIGTYSQFRLSELSVSRCTAAAAAAAPARLSGVELTCGFRDV